jgi:hypothetical protein
MLESNLAMNNYCTSLLQIFKFVYHHQQLVMQNNSPFLRLYIELFPILLKKTNKE